VVPLTFHNIFNGALMTEWDTRTAIPSMITSAIRERTIGVDRELVRKPEAEVRTGLVPPARHQLMGVRKHEKL